MRAYLNFIVVSRFFVAFSIAAISLDHAFSSTNPSSAPNITAIPAKTVRNPSKPILFLVEMTLPPIFSCHEVFHYNPSGDKNKDKK